MNKTHLSILIGAALLCTSIEPGAWLSRSDEQTELQASAAFGPDPAAGELPAVSSPPPGTPLWAAPDEEGSALALASADDDFEGTPRAVNESTMTDEEIVDILLERLSRRHTALSERERAHLAKTILEEARAHDLEPELVIAVIEVESAGYPMAVSHVGARGLMQLMPATGEEVARKRGIPWRGIDTLFDPVVNVRLGTFYLRHLADRYGNVTVALAAYNWGPGAIDRRIASGKTVPVLYIEQVMAAYDRGASHVASNVY